MARTIDDFRRTFTPRLLSLGACALASTALVMGCKPSSTPPEPKAGMTSSPVAEPSVPTSGIAADLAVGASDAAASSQSLGIADAGYTLDALIAAAKKEEPITVVDATGKILVMAENFSKKYNLKATGVKMGASNQEEVLTREAAAHNVKNDVFNMSNLPNVTAQFIPQGIAVSWMPPDLKDQTPEQYQNPAITSLNPWMWAYNPSVYGDKCPVDNMWALTDAKWKGKVDIPDPLLRNETMFWLNQIADNADDKMKQAYQDYYGKPLETDQPTATAEWLKRFAANSVKIAKSDTDVGPVVGASTEKDPVIGFVSTAIFAHARDKKFPLAACTGMKPWLGQLTPRVAVIAAETKSPNTAKLFVHYMMTAEGMAPQMEDGKLSTSAQSQMPSDEPSGIQNLKGQLYVNNSRTTPDDFKKLQYWRDLWTTSSQ